MSYRISGLPVAPFQHLFGLSNSALASQNARRYIAGDEKPGFPDRITLRDVDAGASLLLVNYEHQTAATPYRAAHAIFVAEGAVETYSRENEIPEVMRLRLLSLRAFDSAGWMIDADVVSGEHCEALIERFFADGNVAYIHAHFAKRGCYAARIDRA
jgi:Protein of unknown function (DUF1203)